MAEAAELVALAHKLAEAQSILVLVLFMRKIGQSVQSKLQQTTRQRVAKSVRFQPSASDRKSTLVERLVKYLPSGTFAWHCTPQRSAGCLAKQRSVARSPVAWTDSSGLVVLGSMQLPVGAGMGPYLRVVGVTLVVLQHPLCKGLLWIGL
jgi:hypothetical protein